MATISERKFIGFEPLGNLDGSPVRAEKKVTEMTPTVIVPKEPLRFGDERINMIVKSAMVLFLAIIIMLIIALQLRDRSSKNFMWKEQSVSGEGNEVSGVGEEGNYPVMQGMKMTEALEVQNGERFSQKTDIEAEARAEEIARSAELYMEEYYDNYEFVAIEMQENALVCHYLVKEETEFLTRNIPVLLLCNLCSEDANIQFEERYATPVLEWHLEGEWVYSDAEREYHLSVNRSEGDSLYVNYALYGALYQFGMTGRSTGDMISDGETELVLQPCDLSGDPDYWTIYVENAGRELEMRVYPYGGTRENIGDGAGICMEDAWLVKIDD